MDAPPPSYDAVLQASQAEMPGPSRPEHSEASTRVTVTDPVAQRGPGGGQFTSYKITARSSDPKYKSCNAGDSVVMRRFSEFHLLYTKLRAEFPGTIVPPCPEKNQLETFRKNSAFIEARRQALEVFVNKLCRHRVLRHAEILQLFLEADETTWHVELQRMKHADEQSTLVGKVSQMASDIVLSTKNLTKASSDDKGEEPEYLQYKEYATHLDHHLKDACSRSADFVAKQAAFGEALAHFGQQAANMSKYEDAVAAQAFVDLQTTAAQVAALHSDVHSHVSRVFAAPMKEQHLAMRSLKETMQDRTTALGHKQQAEAAVKAAAARLAHLRSSSSKPETLHQAQRRLNELESAARKAADECELIQARMKDELVIFQSERSSDMTHALRNFALAQAKLSKQAAVQWKALVERMRPMVEHQAAAGAAS